ncbi:PqqD family protein [Aurantiacibacter odishensis]|uniref:PqqD family protein n=1 Tax=Aurantiacibacter odishensis TaxID=1155476 RepID=UPI000E7661D4|nr:PqqD family protein [Aurantiacibacter odishensis]
MEANDSFIRSDEVVAREVGGETVLLDLQAGTYFGLNETGGLIWQYLGDEPRKFSDICSHVLAEYDAPAEAVESDVAALMKDLIANGLAVQKDG